MSEGDGNTEDVSEAIENIENLSETMQLGRMRWLAKQFSRVFSALLFLLGGAILWTWWNSAPQEIGPMLIAGSLLTISGAWAFIDPSVYSTSKGH